MNTLSGIKKLQVIGCPIPGKSDKALAEVTGIYRSFSCYCFLFLGLGSISGRCLLELLYPLGCWIPGVTWPRSELDLAVRVVAGVIVAAALLAPEVGAEAHLPKQLLLT